MARQALKLKIRLGPKDIETTPVKKKSKSLDSHRLSDNYEPAGRVLGTGAFAEVAVYMSKASKREYAVKTMIMDDQKKKDVAIAEIKFSLKANACEFFPTLHDFFYEGSSVSMAFDLIDGEDLFNYAHVRTVGLFCMFYLLNIHVDFFYHRSSLVHVCDHYTIKKY